jgi:hypothetical protein
MNKPSRSSFLSDANREAWMFPGMQAALDRNHLQLIARETRTSVIRSIAGFNYLLPMDPIE